MNKKTIELDGLKNGFAAYVFEQNDFVKGSMVIDEKMKDKKVFDKNAIKLFRSLELLKAYMSSKMNMKNSYKYKIWIFAEGLEIDFDDVQITKNGYEYFNNGIQYYIKENNLEQIIQIGYFTFSNPETESIDDKKQLRNMSMYCMNMINCAVYDIVKFPSCVPAIESITRENQSGASSVIVKLKDSTIKVHICYNNQIMDLNMKRKEEGKRCIPYLRDMDKYRTIFVYMTKNGSENNSYCEKYCEKIKDMILEYLEMNCEKFEPDFVKVEFKGIINTN